MPNPPLQFHSGTPAPGRLDRPAGNHLPRRRLLVVDDDESVRALVARVAKELSFDVEIATDGHLGAERLAAARFDLLVTDIHMPEKDGLELIRIARRLQPTLPIVAMSGGYSYGVSILRTAKLLGASVVLSKPLELSLLIETLGKFGHEPPVA